MTLPPDLEWIARDEIAPDETVEYAAQPSPGRTVLRSFGTWLFAIPWTAFSVFWTVAAAGGLSGEWPSGVGWVFPLFGLPFVAIGLAMLSAPFWAWRKARRSLCVVTDRRAILFEGAGFREIGVRSFAPETLRDIRRTERPDGSGDLHFTAAGTLGTGGTLPIGFTAAGTLGTSGTLPVGFFNVPDVRLAEAAVNALAAPAGAPEARPSDAVDEALEERPERRRERL